MNKKIYIIIILLLIILLAITLVPIVQRICILSNLSNKANKYASSTNFHMIKYSYDDESYVKYEFWQMENSKKIELTSFKNDVVTKIKIYANKNQDNYEINSYIDKNGEKTAYSNIQNEYIGTCIDNVFKKDNYFEFIKSAIFSTVKKTTFDGTECYYILNFDRGNGVLSNGIYVDIETGLIINEIAYTYENETTYPATNYKYDFDNVTEDDFIEPDINDYKILEK